MQDNPLSLPCFRFALVQPVPNGTTLALYREGLDVLRRLEGPLAPVVVIGPYRFPYTCSPQGRFPVAPALKSLERGLASSPRAWY